MTLRLGAAAVIAGFAAVVGLWRLTHDRRRKDWPERAVRFARRYALPLPADARDYLADRLRTSELTEDFAMVAIVPAASFAAIYLLWGHATLGSLAPLLSGVLLAEAAGVVADESRRRRRSSPRMARIVEPELTDVFPPALIWVMRAFGVAPLLAWYAVAHRTWAGLGVAVVALAVTAALEVAERRMLRGPQTAATGLELAYDDAFRVEGLLLMPAVQVLVGVGGVMAIAFIGPSTTPGQLAFVPLYASAVARIVVEAPAIRLRFRRRLSATAIDPDPGLAGG